MKSIIYKSILALLFFWLPILSKGQGNGVLHTENEKAKALYFKALDMQRMRRFDLAMNNLEDAIKKDETFEEAYVLLVKNYEMFQLKEKLLKLNQSILKYLPQTHLAGKALLSNAELEFEQNQFEKAEESIEKAMPLLQKDLPATTRCFQLRQNIKFAKSEWPKPAEKIDLEPLSDELNRFQLQYFPALTADENFLIFTARQGTHEIYDENIYVSRKLKGKWTTPQSISPLINGPENEGTSSINADARILVFTKCGSPEGQGSCDIFMSERVGNNWKVPKPIKEINSPYWDSHPSLSADGRRIFFTSARPGGQGRMDIWYAEKDSNGVWQPPQNAGPNINTPYDEETPFLHANGETLYFASDGHPGFGKIDLFYTRQQHGKWQKPINLGKSINSNKDESGLFITASGKTGLFCLEERRERDLISSEIRIFRLPKSLQQGPGCTYLTGTIFDAATKQRIGGQVELVNLSDGKQEFSMDADKDFGTFTAILKENEKYGLFVSKPGYLFQSLTLSTDSVTDAEGNLKQDIYLEPIRAGASIVLNNIFFESGKADLLPASLVELRKVGKLMTGNPGMQIEIRGHTDDVGKDADNLLLSQKRALAVVEHLHKQGIAKNRMKSVGYGETMPLNDNSSDEKRRLNRRIEFKIIRTSL